MSFFQLHVNFCRTQMPKSSALEDLSDQLMQAKKEEN